MMHLKFQIHKVNEKHGDEFHVDYELIFEFHEPTRLASGTNWVKYVFIAELKEKLSKNYRIFFSNSNPYL